MFSLKNNLCRPMAKTVICRTGALSVLGLFASLVCADAGTQLRVFPEAIELSSAGDLQTIAIQIVNEQGITRDVSESAQLKLMDPQFAELREGAIHPVANGETRLRVELGQQSAEIPVRVQGMDAKREISFRRDVMPVFMKHGCNNGSCHGAARGKDGFMLSLFGYDPAGDYFRLTRAMIGRRVDLAVPEQSLLLLKSLGEVSHTGGQLFDEQSEDYQVILKWLQAGAPDDEPGIAEPVGIELLPSKVVFDNQDAKQRTVVLAKYSDGTVRDVTRLTLFHSNNEAVASINNSGIVSGNGRGGAFVFARFNKYTVGAEVIVLPTNDQFEWPETQEVNYIDTLVFDKLKKLHMAPSPLSSDAAFLRRVYLDLIGLPPTPDEYRAFVDDANPNKRAALIDQLLERKEFDDIWAMRWGELLRIRAIGNQPQYGRDAKAMFPYAEWLRDQMGRDRPLNEIVADLVVGSGSNIRQPTANLYTAGERLTPQKTAEDFAQVFLGTRIQCAQCHNHPFDRWTMDDYYGFASFFAGVSLRRGIEGREVIVVNNNNNQSVEHPVDGRKMKPKFLGGDAPDTAGTDPRVALANWLTSPDNAAFRETMANMIWAHFFGRGIVDPVDDVRISNPPSNKELLEELGRRLAQYQFDRKKLVRDICNSRTYQLSAESNATNELDEAYFSHSYVRRLRAEVLLDTITQVTGTVDRFPSSPPGTRAVQLYSGNLTNYFLTTFGRAPRESACSCEVNREANLSQALHLVNGDTVTQKIAASKLIPSMLAAKKTTPEIITELYVLTLSRQPTQDELDRLTVLVDEQLNNPDRVNQMAVLRAGVDGTYQRLESRLNTLKGELTEAENSAQEPEALQSLNQQITSVEKQLNDLRQRQVPSVPQMVYGDILWGLFNSTEFAFNH